MPKCLAVIVLVLLTAPTLAFAEAGISGVDGDPALLEAVLSAAKSSDAIPMYAADGDTLIVVIYVYSCTSSSNVSNPNHGSDSTAYFARPTSLTTCTLIGRLMFEIEI